MICNKIPSSVCCPVKQSHIVSTILSISGLPESLVQLPVKWPYAISFWNNFVCLGNSGVLLREGMVGLTYLQTVQRRNNDSRRFALARQFKRSEVLFRRNGGTTVLGQRQSRRGVRLLFGLTFRFDALCENNEKPWKDSSERAARKGYECTHWERPRILSAIRCDTISWHPCRRGSFPTHVWWTSLWRWTSWSY